MTIWWVCVSRIFWTHMCPWYHWQPCLSFFHCFSYLLSKQSEQFLECSCIAAHMYILLHNSLWVVIYADLMLGTECACRQQWWRAAKDGGIHKHQNGWQGTSYMSTYIPLFSIHTFFSIFLLKCTIFNLDNLNNGDFLFKRNFSLTNELVKRSWSCFPKNDYDGKRQANDNKRQTD